MFDTLFLDRDGVINKKLERRYVTNFDEFVFVKNSDIAIRKLHKIFKRILIVTNQQGIGKGIMTEDDLNLLHLLMQRKLSVDFDLIDKIYFCPCLEVDNCNCRKPKTGMLENAKLDFPDMKLDTIPHVEINNELNKILINYIEKESPGYFESERPWKKRTGTFQAYKNQRQPIKE